MNRATLVVLGVALLALLALPTASGTTISPAPQPTHSGSCAPEPLIPGSVASYGALVVLLQPGPEAGLTCGLPNGGVLIGTAVILGLYTPEGVPNSTVTIGIEEYQEQSTTVDYRGPNGTILQRSVLVRADATWSNASIPAIVGEVGEYQLNVPSVPTQENLTISLLGLSEQLQIIVPGAGISIPADYPQLLLHDLSFEIYVVIFFVVGVAVAVAIRMRTRHVEKLWPFGVVGVLAAFGFAGYIYADYPQSLVPIGSTPEAVIALPVVFAGIYLWLSFSPTEAHIVKVEFPVADIRDHERLYNERRYREFDGPDGPEYIGPGGAGAFLRLLGVRTLIDYRVLTPTPHHIRYAGFRSLRADVKMRYFAYAELPGGTKPVEVVPPRIWWFPWRGKAREAIEAYHRKDLRGRVDVPTKFGFLIYVTPSRAFVAATGPQGAVLVEGWITGTLQVSKVGLALEKVLVAYTHLKVGLKTYAFDYGHKVALALRTSEQFPDSPIGLKMLEDLATREEAKLMDETEWYSFIERSVEEDRLRMTGARPPVEDVMREARNPNPPDLRSKAARARDGGGYRS